jgi:hypothetical protein
MSPGSACHPTDNSTSFNNNIVSLSLNNPFKYMKGLEFLGLGANKLNTFHENTLPDNTVNRLKTLNLASNPYICDRNLYPVSYVL